MNWYCTFFDRGYLAQGLALWESLHRCDPSAVLWVLALDDETEAVLRMLAVSGIRVMPVRELLAADRALAAIQVQRPKAEFIFSLKPCWCRQLLLQSAEIDLLTYLDSDLYFFGDPACLRRELGEKSVLVVPHRYPAWHDDSASYGTYNAGLMAFRKDEPAQACLDRWRGQCLESCSLTADGVSYGDQKYLDDWPARWGASVKVSENPGVNLAPWNWARHACAVTPDGVEVDGARLVVFHFAQFRPINSRWFDSGQLEYGVMPGRLRAQLYGEYWKALKNSELTVRTVRPEFSLPRRGWRATLGTWRLALLRLFWGQCWLRLGSWWLAGRFGMGQWSGRFMGWYRRWQRRAG